MSKSKLRLLLNTLYFGSIILLCIFMWLTNIHLFQKYGELYFLDLHFHFSICNPSLRTKAEKREEDDDNDK